MENPKESTKKLLELISEYTNTTPYKTNTDDLIVFVHNNNEHVERNIQNALSFNHTQNMTY